MRRAAPLTCAALAVGGCGSDSEPDATLPSPPGVQVPRELREVARLRNGNSALERRPASCRTTHALLIRDGKPKPRRLRTTSGACLIWGNKGSGRVRVKYARAPGGRLQGPPAEFVQPAGSAYGEGPFETLTLREFRQLLSDERGKFGCITIFPETRYGARYYTATNGPVTIPYTIDPGGAKGELVLEPSPTRGASDRGLPPKVREVRRLRCGRQAVDGRPAGCKTPQALLIRDGKPTPTELKVGRRSDCVVWGNKDKRTLRVESEPCPRCFFSLNLPPGEADVTYFRAAVPESLPHPIRYTIEPDGAGPSGGTPRPGAKGTIFLKDR